MKLRSLVLSALLALGIAPMANAAEEVIPTVSSFDFLVDNSGSMLTSPLLNARSKMDLAKDVMARVNAQIPNLPYQGSAVRPHMSARDRAAQFAPFAALTGYEDAVREAARLTDTRAELTEDEQSLLDGKLQKLADALKIKVRR